jgi:hypothetical protein
MKTEKKNLDYSSLKNLYVDKKLSLSKVGKLLKCDDNTVQRYLVKYNIPRRNPGGYVWSEENRKELSLYRIGKKHSEETLRKMSLSQIGKKLGKNHPNWLGGISFGPYSRDFNRQLKAWVRNRDNYVCQECQQPESKIGYKLHVHHIDYDKKNSSPENLISLCRSCHSQTNFSRNDWTTYYHNLLSGGDN